MKLLVGLMVAGCAALAQAHVYTNLHSCTNPNGVWPYGNVVLSGSQLYGMMFFGGSNNNGVVFTIRDSGSNYSVLHYFTGIDGKQPYGSPTLSGTNLYGMTTWGGANNSGVIFKMNTNGSSYTVLHSFGGGTGDGSNPYGNVTVSGSLLYGMTVAGGAWNRGNIFRMGTDGSGYTTLHDFTVAEGGGSSYGSLTLSGPVLYGVCGNYIFKINTDGSGYTNLCGNPSGYNTLVLSGPNLYGMSYNGGAGMYGAVFKVNTDGTGYTNIHSFVGNDGKYPRGAVTLSGSKLLGMTSDGGGNGKGVIFKVNTDGTGFGLLHEFAGGANDGRQPEGSLILSGSMLYGMTHYGGAVEDGVIFSMLLETNSIALSGDLSFGNVEVGTTATRTMIITNSGSGPLTVKSIEYPGCFSDNWSGTISSGSCANITVTFAPSSIAAYSGTIVVNSDALSGGNTIAVSGTGIAPGDRGDVYTNLHSFTGGDRDGAIPYGTPTLSGSMVYGMTSAGGVSNRGVLFSMNADASGYTNLVSMRGSATDGSVPRGDVVVAGSTLYGMASSGGAANNGVVFCVATDGSAYTNLYNFTGSDGSSPYGSLVISNSVLYGMTYSGGASYNGTIFKMGASGLAYTLLHEFTNDDGGWPGGNVTLAGTNLYGMTEYGGGANGGVLFSVNTNGSGYTTLHTFGSESGDGVNPRGSLIQSGADLYGMTSAGGQGNGTLFKIKTDGAGYTNLHIFSGGQLDGGFPYGSLIMSGSSLYGMASAGGAWNKGIVFMMNADGRQYTILRSFAGGADDGATPYGSLALSGSTLYGMTSAGGLSNNGVVFSMNLANLHRKLIGLSGPLDFGIVAPGGTATRTLTITNSGNSTLSVSVITYPTGFSGDWSGSIPAGGSTNITVTFSPTKIAAYGGTVTVNSDATTLGENTLNVSGSGAFLSRDIAVSGDLDFGLGKVGSSGYRTLTIANSGNAVLNVTSISYPSGFSGNWTGMVSPGGATNVPVTFAPSAAMTYGGTVTVNSDATGGTNAISVSGTGWQGYTNLYVFKGGSLDGANPDGSLLLSGAILYGMTERGGDVGYSSDNGVIFRIGENGNGMSIMHHFGGPTSDAGSPWSSFIQSGTNLYGMTYHGGDGGGTIIKISTNGDGYAQLRRFGGGANDGQWPYGDFVQSGSWLYGMARFGGASDGGVAFKFNVDGTGYTNIHSFAGYPSDGYEPFGSLTLSGSAFYGMTFNDGAYGGGVVFRMNLDGSGYTILRNLHYGGGTYDGIQPRGSLVLSGSMLYGMTSAGGVSNLGVVFGISTNGTGYTNLHNFTAGPRDGAVPFGSLIVTGSMLYGMTSAGGVWNSGTVFQMSTTGAGYTNLHDFSGGTGDGANPQGSLTLSGALIYGMTKYGGISNAGTVFVLALPSSGPAGYDAWAASITNGLTNFNQCATGDGYPNLLKYATGSNPTNSDNVAALSVGSSNGLYALRFYRNTNALDVTLLVEGSYSITNGAPWKGIVTNRNGSWGGATNVTEIGTGSPVRVTVRFPPSTATNGFQRLRVTRP